MISPLHIKPDQSYPEVVLDKEKKLFLIKGDILPENSYALFDPIFDWFKKYSKNPNPVTILELDINIINTSATRRLVKLFELLEKIVDENNEVIIKWILLSDDEIMEFTAYEFSNAFKKIKFIRKIK